MSQKILPPWDPSLPGNNLLGKQYAKPLEGPADSTEERLVDEIRRRRAHGLAKYGTSVERSDLSTLEWIQHAKEEALDLAVYLERLKREGVMDPHWYQHGAGRTLPIIGHNHFFPLDEKKGDADIDITIYQRNVDLMHATLGIVGEGGELAEHVKKAMFYGKKIDREAMIKEAGDILWYIAGPLCRALKISLVEIMEANRQKLMKRYPEKYSDSQAIARADEEEA